MIGSSLSRWTMAFFTGAVIFLIAAECLMVAGYGFPAMPAEAPETLLLVHTVTIGWLSLLMCGALLQFVPVLVAQPLRDEILVLPALLCLLAGLTSLLAGFLGLTGMLDTDIPFLLIGGCLLPIGFGLVLWTLGRTLWQARPLPLPARFVAVGLTCLAATFLLGTFFAHILSGLISDAVMIDFRTKVLPVHAAAGFGGWLTFTAIGVSYRLLPMFMLAPDAERTTNHIVWWSGSIALLSIIMGAPVEFILAGSARIASVIAGLSAMVALVCYGFDLFFFYRNRKRRNIELNSKSAIGAFAALYLSAALLLSLLATGTFANHAGALIYLVAFGWLTGLGLSQLYKIVPFLTWLECYGPVMGRKPTPRVQDLMVERRDGPWFVLYFAGLLGGTVALLADAPNLFRITAAMTLLATAAIVIELVLARRLFNVAAAVRFPEGTTRPHLFLPAIRNH
ncbi:hypothetical protein [Chelatococcus asaccharovorans]|uniref:hypothetical protein n=1 Tax=Chelatococcus asaccharovorans TaxID=28210 RepID=UPI00224C7356|nr:hypothetical protein [Chelatococcus asaccharovorans]CAH1662157.1 conserved membrane hypothetical protein [Chelatococcus asaccharovorans]CAH1690523.1 conserved membrane hypothetical protein [Chelatococcus asaccharovorans]